MTQAYVQFGSGALDQDIKVGNHLLRADVDKTDGGEDSAPSPHDYLATALGTCTGITLRMYAKRKNWPLQDVKTQIILEHRGPITHFERVIELVGNLDETQKSRLMEIANACPIHKVLQGKIEIETRLK